MNENESDVQESYLCSLAKFCGQVTTLSWAVRMTCLEEFTVFVASGSTN